MKAIVAQSVSALFISIYYNEMFRNRLHTTVHLIDNNLTQQAKLDNAELRTSLYRCNAVESNQHYYNFARLIYLGIQLEGVLSTSQAAKSFMGTGFDALVIFSDLFFSVILNQHQYTTR